jgi:hypothetical protein
LRQTVRIVALLLSICGTHLAAQEIGEIYGIFPDAPTSADTVEAAIWVSSGCSTTFATTIQGTTVRTDVNVTSCGGPSIPLFEGLVIGRLAPGTYTYQVYRNDELAPGPVLADQHTIVVTAAPGATVGIPALDTTALMLLAVSICMAGFLLLRGPAQ